MFRETGLTLEQYLEAEAYNVLEPIGGYREDFRAAQICLMLHNLLQAQRGDGKWVKATVYDFMPWGPKETKPAEKPQTVDEMKKMLLAIAGNAQKTGEK